MRSTFDRINQELSGLVEELESNSLRLEKIADAVPPVIERIYASLPKTPPGDDLLRHQHDHLVFNWLPIFKEFLTYLRNVGFRLYRDVQLKQDRIDTLLEEEQANQQSADTLRNAEQELITNLQWISELTEVDDDLATTWKHYEYPVGILSEQSKALAEQIAGFPKDRKLLDSVREQIDDKVEQVGKKLDVANNSIKSVYLDLSAVVEKLTALPSNWVEQQLQSESNELERLRESVESTKASLQIVDTQFELPGNTTVPIDVQEFQLLVKQINFNQQVRVWFGQDVYPKLVRLHEENLRLLDLTIVTTFNIRNRIQAYLIDLNQNDTTDASEIVAQLQKLQGDFHRGTMEAEKIANEIRAMLRTNLVVSKVFDKEQDFLDVPLISINQYRRDGSEWLAQSRLRELWNHAGDFWSTKIRPGFRSKFNLAHVIDFVDARSLEEEEVHNQALFLKKGFIGQSFNIARQEFIEQLRRAFISWEKEFRGSMLVYGYRLSGRSSLLQSIKHMDWIAHPVIELKPNTIVEVRSRKYDCGTDLEAALNFIQKHHVVDKVCVVIDDLESWRSSKNTFFTNVRSLIADINRFSKKMYFIVVTNHWMKNHLDLHFDFSGQFVDNYCTDKMSVKDIASAILVRESALRAQVSSEEWQEVQEQHKKRASRIAAQSRQNIGSSLRSWSRQLLQPTDTPVHAQALKHIVDNYWTILSHLMKYGATSEAELSQIVGSNQMKEVNQRLQFLLGCKILVRERSNKLSINDDIVDVLENLMITNSHRKLHAAH